MSVIPRWKNSRSIISSKSLHSRTILPLYSQTASIVRTLTSSVFSSSSRPLEDEGRWAKASQSSRNLSRVVDGKTAWHCDDGVDELKNGKAYSNSRLKDPSLYSLHCGIQESFSNSGKSPPQSKNPGTEISLTLENAHKEMIYSEIGSAKIRDILTFRYKLLFTTLYNSLLPKWSAKHNRKYKRRIAPEKREPVN